MADHAAFLDLLSATGPKITLIGMSGLGKSYWSEQLEKEGFKRFCCDNLIAEWLFDASDRPGSKVEFLGRWMGYPFTPGYEERERAYRMAESEILWELVAYLETASSDERTVIDTTGSAPYAGEAIMKRLSELTRIVHLATSPVYVDAMTKRYMESPRPVVWGGMYHKKPAETEKEALDRCYRALLTYRETLYRQYAHRSVPYHLHRKGKSV